MITLLQAIIGIWLFCSVVWWGCHPRMGYVLESVTFIRLTAITAAMSTVLAASIYLMYLSMT